MIPTAWVFIIIGVIIRIYSVICLKECFSWRVLQAPRIVDYGIYKYVRHPMYTGALILYLGLFLLLTNWKIAILMNIFTINFLIDRIDREEQAMISKFGQEYINYMNRTKIIIPFIW